MKGHFLFCLLISPLTDISPKSPFKYEKREGVTADGYFQGNSGQGVYARRGKVLWLADKPFGNGVLSLSRGKNTEP